MIGERKPHVEQRRVDRVSSAFWPLKTRKGVPTGKAAQRRRDWIMQGRWWIILVDALPMRVLLVLTTLLVVSASLLVALLGLRVWYLLLPPLLLFAGLLIVPVFLVSNVPIEIPPPPPLAQDMRSSSGFISQYAHELRSSAGFVSQYAHELHSSAGILSQHAHELRSEPGLLADTAPATPMPGEPPLVRVLETYDLRATPVRHFLANFPEDTAEQAALRYMTQDIWGGALHEFLQGQDLPTSQVGPDPAQLDASCPGEPLVHQKNGDEPPA
ncbi:MAG: hypothetical protein ACRDHW_24210 [Ktedonobacteraceae bacterium]